MKTFLNFSILLVLFTASFNLNAQSIKVETTGKGVPMVLLPGFASTHDVWETTVNQFKSRYEIHLVNYAGFGELPPVKENWLANVKNELYKYIKDINSTETIIIGHSMGGTLAAWLAAQKELDISQIIIVDGLPATGALFYPNTSLDSLSYDSPYNEQLMAMDDATFGNTAAFMASNMATDTEDQILIKESILKSDRRTYVLGYTDYLKFDVRGDLKNIDIPVTVLGAGGAYGLDATRATFNKQYANLLDYHLIIHPKSKHFIMYDAPQWLANQLDTALEL
jgi:pimeloyl-ACP methyl ester carboxylesterase